jgi:5-methylcytosine-specific restriction enzyme A
MATRAKRLGSKTAKAVERFRGSAHARGYDRKWKAARVRQLQIYPYCKACLAEGVHRLAEVVDHIRPHRGDLVLFWDAKNWQSLCKRHHDQKTARGE